MVCTWWWQLERNHPSIFQVLSKQLLITHRFLGRAKLCGKVAGKVDDNNLDFPLGGFQRWRCLAAAVRKVALLLHRKTVVGSIPLLFPASAWFLCQFRPHKAAELSAVCDCGWRFVGLYSTAMNWWTLQRLMFTFWHQFVLCSLFLFAFLLVLACLCVLLNLFTLAWIHYCIHGSFFIHSSKQGGKSQPSPSAVVYTCDVFLPRAITRFCV